jgi:hypothetical protein
LELVSLDTSVSPAGIPRHQSSIKPIVRLIAPESEADPVALLVQSLIAFGNLNGRRPHIAVGAARHHTNELAVMAGGRPAERWFAVSPVRTNELSPPATPDDDDEVWVEI